MHCDRRAVLNWRRRDPPAAPADPGHAGECADHGFLCPTSVTGHPSAVARRGSLHFPALQPEAAPAQAAFGIKFGALWMRYPCTPLRGTVPHRDVGLPHQVRPGTSKLRHWRSWDQMAARRPCRDGGWARRVGLLPAGRHQDPVAVNTVKTMEAVAVAAPLVTQAPTNRFPAGEQRASAFRYLRPVLRAAWAAAPTACKRTKTRQAAAGRRLGSSPQNPRGWH